MINNAKTLDIYLVRNKVKKELILKYVTSGALIFIGNYAPNIRFLNSLFTDVNILNCEKVHNVIFINVTTNDNIKIHDNVFSGDLLLKLCTFLKNIELKKNEIQHLDIQNTVANDILLENNRIKNTLYINDTKADDIILNGNKVAIKMMNPETKDEEASSKRSQGIFLEICTIEGELKIESNDTPETLQINETLADKLSFIANKTKLFKINWGSYRQVVIYNCGEIGKFYCKNVTVGKDISFTNNIFQDDFDMLYCKIENDLEVINNQFNGFHMLFNNTA